MRRRDRRDHRNARGTGAAHFGHPLGSDPTDRDDRTGTRPPPLLERREPLRGAVLALRRRVVDGAEDEKVGPLAHRLASLGERVHGSADEKPRGPDAAQRAVGSDTWVRCTPSAPTASATSARSLTMSFAPCRRVDALSAIAVERRSPGRQILLPELHGAKPGAEALLHDLGQRPRRSVPVGNEIEREVHPAARLGACRRNPARAMRRVQLRGGARSPGARRSLSTLSARARAPTKQMGPYHRSSSSTRGRPRSGRTRWRRASCRCAPP